jgi:hypothetical protein
LRPVADIIIYPLDNRRLLVTGEPTWLAGDASSYPTGHYSERKESAAKLQSRVNFKTATRSYF